MLLLITELILGDVPTISIPTDAIFIVSLLIVFALIGYFFNSLLSNDTNQFTHTIHDDYNLELVKEKLKDQLALESTILDQENVEKSSIRKINFLPHSKVLGIGSLAIVAMGGANLLGLQIMQTSYESASTSHSNIQLGTESPVFILKPLDKKHTKIKTISYIDRFLSRIQSPPNKMVDKVKGQQNKSNFSF